MESRGAPDKKNLYVLFSDYFFKARAQYCCVLIAVNNSVRNKLTTRIFISKHTQLTSNSTEEVSLLV